MSELTAFEREQLRHELASFLTSASTRRGSDGELLVHYPSNFDVVADSMNRSDLTAEATPWSRYLLTSDKFQESLDQEGRYRNVMLDDKGVAEDERKYDNAMAQIHMYDKQLLEISRKAAQVKAAAALLRDADGCGDDDSDRLSTGRSSSKRSTFFLTRGKDDKSSAATTPRSESHLSSAVDFSSPGLVDEYDAEDGDGVQVPENEANTLSARGATHSSRTTSSVASSKASSKRNAIRENIHSVNRVKASSSLTDDEELRLQTLLDIDEAGSAWMSLSKYGFTDSQLEQMTLLDQELQRFQRNEHMAWESSRHGSNSNQSSRAHVASYDCGDETKRLPDYLTSQREERERNTYINSLESMIRCYSAQKANLSGLSETHGKSHSIHSVAPLSGFVSSLSTDLPQPSTIDVNRVVTMQDVDEIVAASKQQFFHEGVTPSSSNFHPNGSDWSSQMYEQGEEEYNVNSPSSSPTTTQTSKATQSSLASRQDIDRLLSSLRFEIQRLAELRGKTIVKSSSSISSLGNVLLQPGASWQNISPSGSDLEEQMYRHRELESDILARYGIENRPPVTPMDITKGPGSHELHEKMAGFLPQIGSKPSMYIAESFRRKIQSLKASRGLIEVEQPPPRPPSRDRQKVLI